MNANREFISRLRYALKHLYAPNALQESPFIQTLALADSATPASALRQLLIRTIRSLKPGTDVPDQSPLWYHYEILLARYVQQYSQVEVSDRLGLSIRQIRRKEHEAIEALARQLAGQIPAKPPGATQASPLNADKGDDSVSLVDRELVWLREPTTVTGVDLAQALASLLPLVRPMADEYAVHLHISPLEDLPPLAVHPTALRQILLSLLSVAIRCEPREALDVSAKAAELHVQVTMRARDCGSDPHLVPSHDQSLAMAQHLVKACGGTLAMCSEGPSFDATIALPAVRQVPVLVIDDNRDMQSLVQRYSAGTRYQVYGATDLDQALNLAARVPPRAVVLDIMMPGIDGWEVLGRLKHHPLTASAPVVVCTILPEQELARFVGADSFVHKPFTRTDLLNALDRVCQEGRAPR